MRESHIVKVQLAEPRRPKMHVSSLGINHLRRTHPWMAAWQSAMIPGFGHIHLGMYTKGLILMSLEVILNTFSHVNLAILYTFTFQFEKIDEVFNYNWGLIYAAIYIFGIWDSYRVSVEINKQSFLEANQYIRNLKSMMISAFDLDFLDKRHPWISVFWSIIFVGLGHLYCHRLITGFALIAWNLTIIFFTDLPQLILYTFTAQFDQLAGQVNYQWLLFYPSIYLFSIYDSYATAVSYNRIFEEEQIYHLNGKYGKNKLNGI